ncbi:MAG: hypothetical protein LBL60_01665 [Mycoplasmataceae bacterium]|jgi:hypothetical protein|nr:hypothetical protein [Mycoplasmataceae bacterium]
MFGVYRYINTLRKAINENREEIKYCNHSEKGNNNANSTILAKELLDKAGYKFERDYFSFLRFHRVLVYVKKTKATSKVPSDK